MRAAKKIKDSCASIAEVKVYMAMNLPNSLGGYGLKGVTCNYEEILSEEAAKKLKQSRCFLDFCYRREKVDVEYDSKAHHSTKEAKKKDALRSKILEECGYKVLHMNSRHLYNKKSCRNFAYKLARALKTRIRIRSKKFRIMQEQLFDSIKDKSYKLDMATS